MLEGDLSDGASNVELAVVGVEGDVNESVGCVPTNLALAVSQSKHLNFYVSVFFMSAFFQECFLVSGWALRQRPFFHIEGHFYRGFTGLI